MKYICEICNARYDTAKAAMKCEAQGPGTPYKTGEKVLFRGLVVRVAEHAIHEGSHEYSYRPVVCPNDNPPDATLSDLIGFKGKEEFAPYIEKAA